MNTHAVGTYFPTSKGEYRRVGEKVQPRATGYTYNRTLAILLACSTLCTLLLGIMQIVASIKMDVLETKLAAVVQTQKAFNSKTLAFNTRLVNDVNAIQQNQEALAEFQGDVSTLAGNVVNMAEDNHLEIHQWAINHK